MEFSCWWFFLGFCPLYSCYLSVLDYANAFGEIWWYTRRGWHLPNRCYLCRHDEESIHQVLLHYPVVGFLWSIMSTLIGVRWVLPKTGKEALLGWRGSFVGKTWKKAWKTIPICIFWTVWRESNQISFREGSLDATFEVYFHL